MKAFSITLILAAALTLGADRAAAQESGWLGVSLEHLMTVRDRQSEFLLVVKGVVANSPASDAGISRGDTVVSMNGRPMNQANIAPVARGIRPGDRVRMRLRRGGQVRDVVLVAGRRPEGAIVMGPSGRARILSADSVRAFTRVYLDSASAGVHQLRTFSRGFEEVSVYRAREQEELASRGVAVVRPGAHFEATFTPVAPGSFFFETGSRAVAGAEFFELNASMEATLGRKDGLLVLRVGERTPAQLAGLRPGDIIIGAGGRSVRMLGDLRMAVVQAREEVPLSIIRNRKKLDLTLAAAH